MKRAIISCSGGLDSTALLIRLLSEGYLVDVVNFDYGQKHKIERSKLKDNLSYLNEFDFRTIFHDFDLEDIFRHFTSTLLKGGGVIPEGSYKDANMKLTVVPNRNAKFASIIYGLALSKSYKTGDDVKIALGVHSGDHVIYPDCRPKFLYGLYESFVL